MKACLYRWQLVDASYDAADMASVAHAKTAKTP